MALGIPDLVCHHIGSTAVPELMAKPCIDVLGVVAEIQSVRDQASRFESLGYEYRGEYGIPGRAYFAMARPRVHLHVFAEGHPQIDRHLEVVGRLQASPEAVRALNVLKRSLADKFSEDQSSYQAGKADFYEQLLSESEDT